MPAITDFQLREFWITAIKLQYSSKVVPMNNYSHSAHSLSKYLLSTYYMVGTMIGCLNIKSRLCSLKNKVAVFNALLQMKKFTPNPTVPPLSLYLLPSV